MSKWLKPFLFGIWGLLLIPLITPILKKWLEENVFADPNGVATAVFRNAMASTVFDNLLALGQQRWFKFALALNFAVSQITSKSGPRRQDGRRMSVILNLQSCLHSSPPGNLICGHRMSTCTNCRMRHSFVNTSDLSVSF